MLVFTAGGDSVRTVGPCPMWCGALIITAHSGKNQTLRQEFPRSFQSQERIPCEMRFARLRSHPENISLWIPPRATALSPPVLQSALNLHRRNLLVPPDFADICLMSFNKTHSHVCIYKRLLSLTDFLRVEPRNWCLNEQVISPD